MVSGERDETSYTYIVVRNRWNRKNPYRLCRLYIRGAGTWNTAAVDRLRFWHVGVEGEAEKDTGRRGMAQARHLLEHGGLANDKIKRFLKKIFF